MAKEVERKFLVKGDFRKLVVRSEKIIQGYLSVEPGRIVRVRVSGNSACLTIKSSAGMKGIARNEWEYDIPGADAHELLKICLPRKIEKTRHFIPLGKHTIEVDEFHGRNEGLILAEIELGDEDELFDKPAWLGDEVTGDSRYYNSNMI